jgi:hypothetical protein
LKTSWPIYGGNAFYDHGGGGWWAADDFPKANLVRSRDKSKPQLAKWQADRHEPDKRLALADEVIQ